MKWPIRFVTVLARTIEVEAPNLAEAMHAADAMLATDEAKLDMSDEYVSYIQEA